MPSNEFWPTSEASRLKSLRGTLYYTVFVHRITIFECIVHLSGVSIYTQLWTLYIRTNLSFVWWLFLHFKTIPDLQRPLNSFFKKCEINPYFIYMFSDQVFQAARIAQIGGCRAADWKGPRSILASAKILFFSNWRQKISKFS